MENAANQQVFVFHGDEDDAVNVAASRKMMEAFEKAGLAGKSAHYFELPGVTHFSWDFAYRDASLFRRVEAIRRNPFPERVVYSTFSPRYNKAYWLRIDRIDRGFALARVEATQKAGVFDVKTDNVSAFSLLLSPAIAPAGKPVEVQVNGKRAYRGTPKGDVLSFAGGKGVVEGDRRPGGARPRGRPTTPRRASAPAASRSTGPTCTSTARSATRRRPPRRRPGPRCWPTGGRASARRGASWRTRRSLPS